MNDKTATPEPHPAAVRAADILADPRVEGGLRGLGAAKANRIARLIHAEYAPVLERLEKDKAVAADILDEIAAERTALKHNLERLAGALRNLVDAQDAPSLAFRRSKTIQARAALRDAELTE